MVSIPPEPTKEEIDQLRKSTLEKLKSEGVLDTLVPNDLNRFKDEDGYVRRFLMHHDNDQKLALGMAVDTLKWRKENKVNEISSESVDQEMLYRGALNIHNRDIDGCKMLLFTVQLHIKGIADPNEVKRILIYWVERLEREEKGKWITVFFDMRETGFRNMDMDFIQYLINLFKCYYPWILNYIIVYEMPWILNAMWKIIKGWLPPKSIEKIKFVDRKTIQDYVPEDQCLVAWGGRDEYEFEFEPEGKEDGTAPLVNGDLDEKKVHFDDRSSPPIEETLGHSETSIQDVAKFIVEPLEELIFSSNKIGTSASIFLINKIGTRYAFKIKTTSPDKYKVRPSMGIVEPDSRTEVVVTLSDQFTAGLLVKDKFLVIAIPSKEGNINQSEFAELQKTANRADVHEVRLRVGIAEVTSITDSTLLNHVAAPIVQVPSDVISKIDTLFIQQRVLEEKMDSMIRVLYAILFLVIAFLFVFVMMTNNLASSLLSQSASSQGCLKESRSEL